MGLTRKAFFGREPGLSRPFLPPNFRATESPRRARSCAKGRPTSLGGVGPPIETPSVMSIHVPSLGSFFRRSYRAAARCAPLLSARCGPNNWFAMAKHDCASELPFSCLSTYSDPTVRLAASGDQLAAIDALTTKQSLKELLADRLPRTSRDVTLARRRGRKGSKAAPDSPGASNKEAHLSWLKTSPVREKRGAPSSTDGDASTGQSTANTHVNTSPVADPPVSNPVLASPARPSGGPTTAAPTTPVRGQVTAGNSTHVTPNRPTTLRAASSPASPTTIASAPQTPSPAKIRRKSARGPAKRRSPRSTKSKQSHAEFIRSIFPCTAKNEPLCGPAETARQGRSSVSALGRLVAGAMRDGLSDDVDDYNTLSATWTDRTQYDEGDLEIRELDHRRQMLSNRPARPSLPSTLPLSASPTDPTGLGFSEITPVLFSSDSHVDVQAKPSPSPARLFSPGLSRYSPATKEAGMVLAGLGHESEAIQTPSGGPVVFTGNAPSRTSFSVSGFSIKSLTSGQSFSYPAPGRKVVLGGSIIQAKKPKGQTFKSPAEKLKSPAEKLKTEESEKVSARPVRAKAEKRQAVESKAVSPDPSPNPNPSSPTDGGTQRITTYMRVVHGGSSQKDITSKNAQNSTRQKRKSMRTRKTVTSPPSPPRRKSKRRKAAAPPRRSIALRSRARGAGKRNRWS